LARPLRLEFPGAIWHVTSRGNEKGAIFRDSSDRKAFLQVLAKVVDRFHWRVHAFVLMGNHYHLLMETPEPTLSRGMRELNGIYTQRFNKRHERVGHLMQGRFKGILVEKESHLLELTRYVVLNPVRAGLVGLPALWRWSNYRATAGLEAPPEWLDVAWTLGQFARDESLGRQRYQEFVAVGLSNPTRPFDAVRGQIFLGSETFWRTTHAHAAGTTLSEEFPQAQRLRPRPSIDRVVRATAASFGVDPSSLIRMRNQPAKAICAHLARTEALEKLKNIGRVLAVRPSWAARLARRGETIIANNSVLRQKALQIAAELRGEDKSQT
jgi:REP element-mobilizing transposase RayT